MQSVDKFLLMMKNLGGYGSWYTVSSICLFTRIEIQCTYSASAQVTPSKGKYVQGFDFTFRGVLEIWEGFTQMSTSPRVTSIIATAASSENGVSSTPVIFSKTMASKSSQNQNHSITPRAHIAIDMVKGPWQEALNEIASWIRQPSSGDEDHLESWHPFTSTQKLDQREIALALCSWSLRVNDVRAKALK